VEDIHGQLADPEYYRTAGAEVAQITERLKELENELEAAYLRWEELEEVGGNGT